MRLVKLGCLACLLVLASLTMASTTIVRPTIGVVGISDNMSNCDNPSLAYDGNLDTTTGCWTQLPYGDGSSEVLVDWYGFGAGIRAQPQ
jgi:hypothetical protein